MGRNDIQDAIQMLAKMAELEIAVSRFYSACGERWDVENSVWSKLASMEIQHAVHIRKIADLIRKKPGKFTVVRFVNVSGMDAIVSRLKDQTKRVAANLIPQNDAVRIAVDTEDSLLEMLFTKIFETGDAEYQDLMSRIVSETVDHRDFFNKEAEALKAKKGEPPPSHADIAAPADADPTAPQDGDEKANLPP